MYYFDIETLLRLPKSIVQYWIINDLAAQMAIARLTEYFL